MVAPAENSQPADHVFTVQRNALLRVVMITNKIPVSSKVPLRAGDTLDFLGYQSVDYSNNQRKRGVCCEKVVKRMIAFRVINSRGPLPENKVIYLTETEGCIIWDLLGN